MSTKRKKIPNSVRFEVFKRDKFTCQFCGGKAPDVTLQIDHVIAVSNGGSDDILNLLASCVECNSGKSNRPLSDRAMLEKSRRQLEDLEERRQQLEMMVKWRESLTNADDTLLDSVSRQISAASGYGLNDHGRSKFKRLIKDFGYNQVCEAISTAMERYLEWNDGKATKASAQIAFDKVGGICSRSKFQRENPEEAQLYFALNIWKKAASYPPAMTCKRAMDAIRAAHAAGMEIEEIKRTCSNSPWVSRLEQNLLSNA